MPALRKASICAYLFLCVVVMQVTDLRPPVSMNKGYLKAVGYFQVAFVDSLAVSLVFDNKSFG